MDILTFLILGLATWRLSSFIAQERGPYAIFDKLRLWAGIRYENGTALASSEFAMGISCTHCNSVWIGVIAGVSWLIFGKSIVWIALPLALSALAIIVGKIVDN